MTKVEELRDGMKRTVAVLSLKMGNDATQEKIEKAFAVEIDSLIAAAKEEERERIRHSSEFLAEGEAATWSNFLDDVMDRATGRFIVRTLCACYVVPAPALSPAPKEEK